MHSARKTIGLNKEYMQPSGFTTPKSQYIPDRVVYFTLWMKRCVKLKTREQVI